jgi:hypothetical protein
MAKKRCPNMLTFPSIALVIFHCQSERLSQINLTPSYVSLLSSWHGVSASCEWERWTPHKEGSSCRQLTRSGPLVWRVGQGLTRPHCKKKSPVIKCYTRPWMDSFEWPKQWKMDMSFGTWNVRSLYRLGLLKTAARELQSISQIL